MRVDRALLVEETDKSLRIGLLRGGIERSHQGHQGIARVWILKVGADRQDGRALGAVIGIRHEDRIAGFRESFAHLTKCRPQTEGVRPDQHGRMLAAGRVNKVSIATSVRSLDLDIRLGDCIGGGRRAGQPGRKACADSQRRKAAPAERVAAPSVFYHPVQFVFVAHGLSPFVRPSLLEDYRAFGCERKMPA